MFLLHARVRAGQNDLPMLDGAIFVLLENVQSGSGFHPSCCSMSTGAQSGPGVKFPTHVHLAPKV
jgi:hypothetical protein